MFSLVGTRSNVDRFFVLKRFSSNRDFDSDRAVLQTDWMASIKPILSYIHYHASTNVICCNKYQRHNYYWYPSTMPSAGVRPLDHNCDGQIPRPKVQRLIQRLPATFSSPKFYLILYSWPGYHKACEPNRYCACSDWDGARDLNLWMNPSRVFILDVMLSLRMEPRWATMLYSSLNL